MRLETKRLYLRPLHVKDAEGNYPNWLNDKEVCKYNSHGDSLYTKEMALSYMQSIQNNPLCKVFAVCLRENNKHIGNISLQQINKEQKSAEFAILMGEKKYWGKGYATEAGKALIAFGFEKLALEKIYCGTDKKNRAMQKVATALGMQLDTSYQERRDSVILHYLLKM